jgi:S-adenosylmethionine synthetase
VIQWLRPDAKTQVSIEYKGYKPLRASAIVVSTQHAADVKQKEIRETLIELLIKKVMPAEWLDKKTTYLINPTGRFVVGGPEGDAGITERNNIVESNGGMGRHGGGAFSGKDPSKVDRSAAYMGRWVAKNVVASGLADRCEVQFAYAIGHPEPVSVSVDTFCTGKVDDEKLERAVCEVFNFKPAEIIKQLNLLRPIYRKTTNYGHFGRVDDLDAITWERTDKAEALRRAAS